MGLFSKDSLEYKMPSINTIERFLNIIKYSYQFSNIKTPKRNDQYPIG